jgi:hypothetical protein
MYIIFKYTKISSKSSKGEFILIEQEVHYISSLFDFVYPQSIQLKLPHSIFCLFIFAAAFKK